ncbi:MAG: hypothetical protein JWL86_5291 [Rhizobium sp.]|nr:hypothetical protein [Rhizobium sp.]
MAIRMLIAGVAAIGGPLWWFSPTHQATATDAIVTASVDRGIGQEEFTVSNMENRTACLITKGMTTTPRSSTLTAGADCDAVWPGLVQVNNWTENDDGTVVLTDSRGEQVLTLAVGDGVDFESLEPSNAVLALTAVN